MNKRRFPRAQVSKTLGGVSPDLHAQIAWPNHEISEVADLSYKGMAVRRPGMFPIGVQQRAEIEISLGRLPPFLTTARIAWCNADWVGLEFSALSADGHVAMAEYLDAKLVGTALKPVESVFVNPQEGFQFWFRGPGLTNVYIWKSEIAVERVRVDMNGRVSDFVRGQPRLELGQDQRRALLVLSQMDKEGLPMEEFVRSLLLGA